MVVGVEYRTVWSVGCHWYIRWDIKRAPSKIPVGSYSSLPTYTIHNIESIGEVGMGDPIHHMIGRKDEYGVGSHLLPYHIPGTSGTPILLLRKTPLRGGIGQVSDTGTWELEGTHPISHPVLVSNTSLYRDYEVGCWSLRYTRSGLLNITHPTDLPHQSYSV